MPKYENIANRIVGTTCLKYVVPFYIENINFDDIDVDKIISNFNDKIAQQTDLNWVKNDINNYGNNKADNKVDNKADNEDNKKEYESDLYKYIREEFLFDESGQSSKVQEGVQWVNKEDVGIELRWFKYKGKPEECDLRKELNQKVLKLKIIDKGLRICKNHIGFFWYEIELDTDLFTGENLCDFQRYIKEYLSTQVNLWRVKEIESENDANGFVYKEVVRLLDAEETVNKGEKSLLESKLIIHKERLLDATRFSIAEWILDQLNLIPLEGNNKYKFFAERSFDKQEYNKYERDALQASGVDIEFEPVEKQKPLVIPDKPLLFTYCLLYNHLPEKTEDVNSFIFHLAGGYSTNFKYSRLMDNDIIQAFGNVYWYACKEGIVYLALTAATDSATGAYKTMIKQDLRYDYFTLYLKTLYQSYSLLLYAKRIQKEIASEYKKLDEKHRENIRNLYGEINLFLTNGMATSVSHLHHQCEFYIFLKKQLRIHEDIKSISAGTDALEMLVKEEKVDQDEKRSKQIQAGVGLLTVLSLFSAFNDAFDFFKNFTTTGDFWNLTMEAKAFQSVVSGLNVFFGIFILISVGMACKEAYDWRKCWKYAAVIFVFVAIVGCLLFNMFCK